MEMLAIIRAFIFAVLSQLACAVDVTFTDSYGDWELLINFENSRYTVQPNQLFDTSTANTWIENADNPSAMVFMKIGEISDWTPYRGSDGKLTFQVIWNEIKNVVGGPFEVIFKQDSPPTTHLGSVTGYEEIHSHSRLTAYEKFGTYNDPVNCICQMGGMGWNQCLAPMNTWDIASPGPVIDGSSTIAFSATTYILKPATSTITITSTSTNTSTTATLTTTTLTNTSTTATLTTTTLTNTTTTVTLTTTTLTTTTLTTISITATATSTTSTATSTTSTATSTTSTATSTTSTATATLTMAESTTGNQTNKTNATTNKTNATTNKTNATTNKTNATTNKTNATTGRGTSKPSPAPTPKPTSSAPTPAPATTKAADIKLSMSVAGISFAALQGNPRLKREIKAAAKKSIAEEFNALWTEGPAISTSDITVTVRKALASARRLTSFRRLVSAPRRLAETAEVILDAVIAFPAPVDQSAVEQAVTAGASQMATAMAEEISEIPDIESVTKPGARISATLSNVVSTAADDPAETPIEEESTTPPAPSTPAPTPAVAAPSTAAPSTAAPSTAAPSTAAPRTAAPSTPAPTSVVGRGGLPCGDEAAGVCTGNATELCRYDESCSRMPPWRGGLGCNAGGVGQNCRFCGFKFFLPCDFDPSDNSLPCKAEPAAVCAGPTEPCYLDRQCTSLPPALQGLGCNAGGAGQDCRFCGFGIFPPCPLIIVA